MYVQSINFNKNERVWGKREEENLLAQMFD